VHENTTGEDVKFMSCLSSRSYKVWHLFYILSNARWRERLCNWWPIIAFVMETVHILLSPLSGNTALRCWLISAQLWESEFLGFIFKGPISVFKFRHLHVLSYK
jgi:hypothetical protein